MGADGLRSIRHHPIQESGRMRLTLLVPALLLSACGFAADLEQIPVLPDADSFTMNLRDQERHFLTWHGSSWLVATDADWRDPDFLDGKDVVVIAKFQRQDGRNAVVYTPPQTLVSGNPDLWKTRLDGDNLYLFGHCSRTPTGGIHLETTYTANAPSDRERIDRKLAGIPNDDWTQRLAAADWLRATATTQGNREFWLGNADSVTAKVAADMLVAAESHRDLPLALRVIDLHLDRLHDPRTAASIASLPWVRTCDGYQDVAKRMRSLSYDFAGGRWLPRGEAMVIDFEARFQALRWNDADGFFKLGLWCEANSDLLPNARDLSYRCFQAGHKADPNHNGLRRELGLPLVAGNTNETLAVSNYTDPQTKITVTCPTDWKRSEAIGGDATWVDPHSETAYLTARMLRDDISGTDLVTLWESQLAGLRGKEGFTAILDEALIISNGTGRHLQYTFKEGRFLRHGSMALLSNGHAAVRLDASCAEDENETTQKKFMDVVGKVRLPAPTGAPASTDPQFTPAD
jgi:hypothetical protein